VNQILTLDESKLLVSISLRQIRFHKISFLTNEKAEVGVSNFFNIGQGTPTSLLWTNAFNEENSFL
jgi:hypothetical protein